MSDDSNVDFDPEELAMLRGLFREEANDALETVTTRVLASGSARPNSDALTEMMRVTHTLKGAAGTVGLHAMVDLSHRFEDAIAKIGKGGSWSSTSADLIVEITDGLRTYLERIEADADGAARLAADVRVLIVRLADGGRGTSEMPAIRETDPRLGGAGSSTGSTIGATTPSMAGSRSSPSIAVPSSSPSIAVPTATRTAPTRPSDVRIDVVVDSVENARPRTASTPPLDRSPIGEAIVAHVRRPPTAPPFERSRASGDGGGGLRARPATAPVFEEFGAGDSMSMPIPTIVEEPGEFQSGPIVRPDSSSDLAHEPKAFLRVEPERIDALMSSAGELLFDRTRIERRVQLLRTLSRDLARTRQTLRDSLDGEGPPSRAAIAQTEGELASQATLLSQTTAALLDEIEALRRTIGELQRGLTRIRMESARKLMSHAARTLRALRRATGVRVDLRTVGEDTEFDKAVAEQLLDPITQLLRNAVAHGVEPPEERLAKGKSAIATITIRARQDGNLLILEVSDDGRGIDTTALRNQLVANGHWSEARAQLASETDILDALLGTGVSSRDDADQLAGRGIGVGLVRETVAKLGGELALSSLPGRGTTFALRLPLSTALAQAMLFKVGGQVYAIPHVHVAETTLVEPHATTTLFKHEQIPVVRLETLLGNGVTNDRRPAVVVSFAGKALACTVDKIVGPREIIVKPLGPLLAPLTLYAGATISGSGKIQLILDPAQLVRRAYPDAPSVHVDAGSAPVVLAGRALVVDDSRAIREAMTSMLGREGWIVDVAEDGARAIQMTKQLRYDLVVTDLEMPELGGWELIAHLRKDDRFKSVPIVIITSRASPEHRRRAKDLGVLALVAKPITRRKLLEALAAKG